jgi:hypothetical protein
MTDDTRRTAAERLTPAQCELLTAHADYHQRCADACTVSVRAKHRHEDIVGALRAAVHQGAELARLRTALEWQPIETAPKDGTDVLLGWFELPGMKMRRVGHWHPRENAWIDTHHVLHNQHSFPTHWAALLDPPALASEVR